VRKISGSSNVQNCGARYAIFGNSIRLGHIGPSGSGKTTFLRCLNHLETIDSGEIVVDGKYVGYRKKDDQVVPETPRAIAQARRKIGFVFQHFNLFLHMTALENVTAAPINVLGVSQAEAEEHARQLPARVGLSPPRE
jgi:polar amino acid transport system ATP-binding protein